MSTTMLPLARYLRWRLASVSMRRVTNDGESATSVTTVRTGTPARQKRMPRQPANGKSRQLIAQRRGETIMEHFRRVYLSIQSVSETQESPTIGVTSAVGQEGRTTIATGVAAAMASDLESPVVLIEADLSNPGLHRVLGIAPQPGICEYLRGESELSTALRQISDRLFVLPAGDARGEAPRLMRQLMTNDLHQRLESTGAILVYDLPPVLTSSYGVLATTLAETLAFVVRAGSTSDSQVKDALSRLDESMVGGLVLNGAQPQLPRWLRERL
jgi:Mrp family chromosome partitioning ATPase